MPDHDSRPAQRRLTTILAADVVGFSRLMGMDEEGTLNRIKALRRDVIEPKVQQRQGRIVKTTGDGFLIEFQSPVEAVRCALASPYKAQRRYLRGSSLPCRISKRALRSTSWNVSTPVSPSPEHRAFTRHDPGPVLVVWRNVQRFS